MMTTHERFTRMYEHREADRIPIFDSPWSETIDRWCAEGMPTRDYVSYFNLDKVATISVDNSPRYEEKVLEETDEYRIYTTSWGATQKSWKKHGSTPRISGFQNQGRGKVAGRQAPHDLRRKPHSLGLSEGQL